MKHDNKEGSSVTTNSTWIRPEVRQAFAAASREVFNRSLEDTPHVRRGVSVFAQFAQRYDTLCALPRRARRALQRSWRKPLATIALLLTLGQGTALAATINVDTTQTAVNVDGKCSLAEAIVNANNNTATHSDCAAGVTGQTRLCCRRGVRYRSSTPTIQPRETRSGCLLLSLRW